MANPVLTGTYDELPGVDDASVFVVTAPPVRVGVYLSDGVTWARFTIPASLLTGAVAAARLTGALVTVQAGDPTGGGGAFVTPLVYDSTAVTGGLYAWTGTVYVKIGGLVS